MAVTQIFYQRSLTPWKLILGEKRSLISPYPLSFKDLVTLVNRGICPSMARAHYSQEKLLHVAIDACR